MNPSHQTSSGLSRRGIFAIAGGMAALLVVALIVGLTAGGGTHHRSPGASVAAPSPHQICVLQLTAAVADIVDNQSKGSMTEMYVNGQSDPYYTAASQLMGQVEQDEVNIGMAAAVQHLRSTANQVCAQQLGNRIRPNYPIDGTHP